MMTDKKPVKKTRKPAAKKTVAKKAAPKKAPVKKAEPKKPELTDKEKTISKVCCDMLDKGYKVQIKCVGRARIITNAEDLLSYIQANPDAYELVGMKSGAQALCYRIG